jgi:hypothetical protein
MKLRLLELLQNPMYIGENASVDVVRRSSVNSTMSW